MAQPAEDPTDDSYPHTYEHSLDRIACALGGGAVLPPAFAFIPAMLRVASHDWRLRHAGLMAITAIAEGTSKVMQQELGKIVECVSLSRLPARGVLSAFICRLVTPMFKDPHPRVRYAACQCM